MSIDRYHSIPKKNQPANHSTQPRTATHSNHSAHSTEPNICPEINIAEFKYPKTNQTSLSDLYICNLNVDYGRLQRPSHFYHDECGYKKVVKFSEEVEEVEEGMMGLSEVMETKRVKGISKLIQLDGSQKQTEKKRVHWQALQVDTAEKRSEDDEKAVKGENGSDGKGQRRNMVKSKIRLHEVRPKVRLQEVQAYEQPPSQQPPKRRLHSRIVKMFVAGGETKTKVICYPDNSEYLRLWGQK